jgi:hypothetical protein
MGRTSERSRVGTDPGEQPEAAGAVQGTGENRSCGAGPPPVEEKQEEHEEPEEPKPSKKAEETKEAKILFERLWSLYPNKKGKGQVSDTAKKKLLKIGHEELERAIKRYKTELEKEDWRKPQYGSTFFNSGYLDYLDANYEPGKREPTKQQKENKFNNFNQRDYDFTALEQALTGG